jgi:GNAT superfamily N-acetyltransferase
MWWRLPRARYERQKGAGNRRALRRLAGGTRAPGLLAYRGIDPIGWCAVGPREDFLRLAGARVLRPIDDERVWTVTCLFVAREARGRRVSVALLRGAARFAAAHGARILEGYPVDTRGRRTADVFIAMGTLSCFRDAGFREVARASPVRPVMRRRLRGS